MFNVQRFGPALIDGDGLLRGNVQCQKSNERSIMATAAQFNKTVGSMALD
jgi:hypothetical protein